MFRNENRFVVIHKEGSEFKTEGVRQILMDRATGALYLLWKCGYGAGITPLLDSQGNPIIERAENDYNGY